MTAKGCITKNSINTFEELSIGVISIILDVSRLTHDEICSINLA